MDALSSRENLAEEHGPVALGSIFTVIVTLGRVLGQVEPFAQSPGPVNFNAPGIEAAAGNAADSTFPDVARAFVFQNVAGKRGAMEEPLEFLVWMLFLKTIPFWLKVVVGDAKYVDRSRTISLFPSFFKFC